ncbi:hypothetical protein PsorP6_009269 [Peronosclerospora sorghi]|uniref:Uncharacterized protein n=1 Tax=Peronosclerospora sorghi TaxID=230839 RepID=A0ACC0W0J1_9STRA|nr:hypothetical protein PsorP6_009269 [Peronosclerospora sorghi]
MALRGRGSILQRDIYRFRTHCATGFTPASSPETLFVSCEDRTGFHFSSTTVIIRNSVETVRIPDFVERIIFDTALIECFYLLVVRVRVK